MDGIDKVHYTSLYFVICLIIYFTLVPFISSIFNLFNTHQISYNLEPFVDWKYQYGNYIIESLYNILLFVPFGFFFLVATKKNIALGILYGFLLSTCIEIIQPLISELRVGDISDIITNTFGTIIGLLLAYLLTRQTK